MKRIAVTGSGGFVGRQILERAEQRGLEVVRVPTVELLDAALARGQTSSIRSLSAKLTGCEVLVHAGGLAHRSVEKPDAFDLSNHLVTRVVASAAADAGIVRVVYISSIAVHGRNMPARANSHTPVRPDSPYGLSKARAEEFLSEFALSSGTEVLCLRPPLVCGAQAPGNLAMLRRAVMLSLPLPAPSWNKRDLLGVRNLADIIIQAVVRPLGSRFCALPVCDGAPVSAHDILSSIAYGAGRTAVALPISRSALRSLSGFPFVGVRLEQLCGNLEVDGREFMRLLAFSPRYQTQDELASTGRGAN